MPDPIISLKHVSAGYGKYSERKPAGTSLVLKDISLDIAEGRSVCLLGPNGSGKSTLLRVIAGMLPAYGEVLVDGKNIKTLRRKEIASCISYMSQMSKAYYSFSVYETVMQGRYVHGGAIFAGTSSKDKEIVDGILETLKLTDISGRMITALSGGQLQRVMLARCMAQESPVLILDEPMNHLDLKVQSELMDYLFAWREKPVKTDGGRTYQPTVIGVFHDNNIAACMADEMALISEGRLLAFGEKDAVLTEELLEEAYRFNVMDYLRKISACYH